MTSINRDDNYYDDLEDKFRDWLYSTLLMEGMSPEQADEYLDGDEREDYRLMYEDRLAYDADVAAYHGVAGVR
jgi:hypothetical protein